ncbi:receptor-like serine/threonine-protein kinase [Forsythia ovata]|uniref:Receptor-like serine/threonine-protein kinase n=1 Tax=Forsythia ovata TaxID=205694 RepID=A0ABD1T7V5_9LAMI
MLAVWMGTQADEACPEAWHSDSHSMNQTSLADTRSKVYFSPKLYYLRVHVIAAQDLVPSEKGRNLETSVRSQLPPTTPPVHHQTTRHLVPPLAGGLTAAVSFIILLTLCFRRIRKKRTAHSASDTDSKKPPHRLSYSLLRRATNNFSSSLRLGQGGFGSVYRATLKTNPITKNSSFHVAVKLMDAGSLQGEREFQNELLFSSKIDCKYIVSVMGFSSNPGKRRMLLVYELMENGSLQDCLFHRKSEELKNWDKRFLIALYIAKGLEYLHHYCDPPIIHGDIKPNNILLDGNFSANIGDFGLARSKVEDNIESEVKKEGNLENGVEDNGSVVEETESVITASGFEDFNNVHNLGGVERSPDSVVVRVEASPEAVVGVELSPEADAAAVVSPRTVAEMAFPSEGLDKTSISEGNFDRKINVRIKLEETLPGTAGGKNPNDKLLVISLFLLPVLFLVFCYYWSFLQTRSLLDHIRHLYYKLRSGGVLGYSSVTSSNINSNQQFPNLAYRKVPIFLGAVSVVVCLMAAIVSLVLSLSIVPRKVMPWTGFLLVYEWTFTIFFLLVGSYLHIVYRWRKLGANQSASLSSHPESVEYDSGKGHFRHMSCCDVATWYYGLGAAFLALATPLLPSVLGVTALFLRLGLMVMGGLILASFMTYAAEHLSIRRFTRGYEDRDAQRTRNICSFC